MSDMRITLDLAKPMPEPGVFFEGGEGFQKDWPSPLFLSDDEYARILEAFPRACSDVIAVRPESKSFLLAKRKHYSALGVWAFGGGQRMGETPREAAARLMKREIGVNLLPEDFQFLGLSVSFWIHRNPEPQQRGEHGIIFTFVFVPTTKELQTISQSLDPEEYDLEHGICAYTLADLESLKESHKVKLIEHWHAVFG